MFTRTQIKTYEELRRQPVGSYFFGISTPTGIIRAYRITKINNDYVDVFSEGPGRFHFDNFGGGPGQWSYCRATPSILKYINLFNVGDFYGFEGILDQTNP